MRKNTILSQMLQIISRYDFKKCVTQHLGDHYAKKFHCWNQFLVNFYAQGKGLNSLRDISSSFQNYKNRWYHLGLESVARSTLSDANNKRSYEIYEDFFYSFLGKCQTLCPKGRFRFKNPLYTMDSTTISLCLSMFPWAKFRKRKGALKLHTLLDNKGSLPSFLTITPGKVHDVKILQEIKYGFPALEPDSIITMDKGYIDFKSLFFLSETGIFFVTRAKDNLKYRKTGQQAVKKGKGVIVDQTIELTGFYQGRDYPKPLRLIKFKEKTTGKTLTFLTNHVGLAASTIASIYKARWDIELFFKWIKQNLKIKTFLGTSKNAVLTQIWTAMIYYLMLAFIKFQTKYSFSMTELTKTVRDLMMEPVSLIEILRTKFDRFYKNIKPEQIQMSLPGF